MPKSSTKSAPGFILSAAIYVEQAAPTHAQQPTIKRTDLGTADQSPTDVGSMWIADIPTGGATGRHTHPTPRFVYVLEGSVVLEIDGKSPQTFGSGEGFAEPPSVVHNFRNVSPTAPAKAIGFQAAPKGMPLQSNIQ
jgi:quercetin dioxygenase-like cupin family protein